ESIGKSLIENFRKVFIKFEPVSHFHIKVYYRYQLAEIQIMRIGAIINEDPVSLNVADNLLGSISDKNNPLSFMNADWSEFKSVPNSVRNKTLNKCINISKGDLPLAAEHLDFSYRNLRSYITFKEVNRLGFFLDMQQTSNRQLEQGIRYMFYDLYKKGTIFEVVFDMPKFLVNYAKSGFYSQDLEQELDIKGTTAKKYIKIMMEIGLIRQDKTTGRKHYYRLVRENVMNRLGKDQNTLIQSS
ncbi:MAG: helix-turn-helix domain-containing protein, partial [Bacteroidota bacterium]